MAWSVALLGDLWRDRHANKALGVLVQDRSDVRLRQAGSEDVVDTILDVQVGEIGAQHDVLSAERLAGAAEGDGRVVDGVEVQSADELGRVLDERRSTPQ